MNMPPGHDEPDLPTDEWRIQEQALRAERLGLSEQAGDARLIAYRQVARALRQPLPDPLPADFAERVAAKVVRAPTGASERFDQLTGMSLMLLLLLAGASYGMVSPAPWLQAVTDWAPLHVLDSPWLLSLGLCSGLTALWRTRPGKLATGAGSAA